MRRSRREERHQKRHKDAHTSTQGESDTETEEAFRNMQSCGQQDSINFPKSRKEALASAVFLLLRERERESICVRVREVKIKEGQKRRRSQRFKSCLLCLSPLAPSFSSGLVASLSEQLEADSWVEESIGWSVD